MKAEPLINFHNGDNLTFMRGLPDKAYNLAIVDPPYGIGDKLLKGGKNGTVKFHEQYELNQWDDNCPDETYFSELFRVSQNQIIWGANYYSQYLPPSRGIISWDKNLGTPYNFSHFELAWTSFDCIARKCLFGSNTGKRIHPTQKPVALYKWLLQNYAKPGDKILDTHGGSMSIAIACYDLGFDLDICEIDADYFKSGVARFKKHKNRWHEGMSTAIKDETDYSKIGMFATP